MTTNYTLKERLGMALEDFIFAMLKSQFPAKEGFRILAPDKTNYNNHHGVDFRVFNQNKEIMAIECKNWRKLRKKYGLGIAQSEIVSRFSHVGTGLKLLIISHMDTLTEPSLRSIRAHGITIVEVSKLIGYKDFKTSLFGELLRKIAAIFKKPSKVAKGFGCCLSSGSSSTSLTSYCSSSVNTTTNKTIPTYNSDHNNDPVSTLNPYERLKLLITLTVNHHG